MRKKQMEAGELENTVFLEGELLAQTKEATQRIIEILNGQDLLVCITALSWALARLQNSVPTLNVPTTVAHIIAELSNEDESR